MTYRVAAQLKIPTVSFKKIFISQLVFKFLLFLNCLITMAVVLLIIHFNKLKLFRVYRAFHVLPDWPQNIPPAPAYRVILAHCCYHLPTAGHTCFLTSNFIKNRCGNYRWVYIGRLLSARGHRGVYEARRDSGGPRFCVVSIHPPPPTHEPLFRIISYERSIITN